MPHAEDNAIKTTSYDIPRKIVLCFDGTGNEFMGNTSDTNIVKLYDKLDRKAADQYSYYQTGIGTYDISGGSVNKGFFSGVASEISKTLDSGFATTFDAHVIAGYRFVMRYHKPGDKIYIFGFSRGAFTARFLARMIYTVGLLSEGNEEMVPFAYSLYQQYEMGKLEAHDHNNPAASTPPADSNGTSTEQTPLLPPTQDDVDPQQLRRNKIDAFKSTFCRNDIIDPESGNVPDNIGVKVHFLGMFDCVSSVAVLEGFGKVPKATSVIGTARHVRHAVAVDERRVKFKAALLQQDKTHSRYRQEDIKEVWFPGNHGDVGGGWPARPRDAPSAEVKRTWWQKFKAIFTSAKDPDAAVLPGLDSYQMSDVPLAWMIRELEEIGKVDSKSAIRWSERKEGFKKHFYIHQDEAHESPMHDTLKILGGSSVFKVWFWNIMEWLPLPRWELQVKNIQGVSTYDWSLTRWPPNRRGTRDIPDGALLHHSLKKRFESDPNYAPCNNRGDNSPRCLSKDMFMAVKELQDGGYTDYESSAGVHNIYRSAI